MSPLAQDESTLMPSISRHSEKQAAEMPSIQPTHQAFQAIVEAALFEDLAQGDVTTDNLPALAALEKIVYVRTREACVVSGLSVATLVFQRVDSALRFVPMTQDGAFVAEDTILGTVQGSMASILKAERTALNFLQHLCGIATVTHRYVEAIAGTKTRITHTRKTTPGLRLLEQQAVLHGGGAPHRFNLGTCVMLKDNHLEALTTQGENPIANAIRTLRARISHTTKIEVEADRLEQVQHAVDAGADIILLDNMSPAQIRQALSIIQGRTITEASGGISLETVRAYAETGVNYISTSKITLGVPAIDIGLDLDSQIPL
jgi:nicotinate-nucleotide pyrophosphorylase (carboxylating)